MSPAEVASLLPYCTPAEKAELYRLLEVDSHTLLWRPLPGPQSMAFLSKADVIGYGGAAGGGKGLALDTPVVTPNGWSTMGALREGDQVFAPDGRPCTVMARSEINQRPCFRLTFDDGAVLVADDVHRWVTFDSRELAALTRCDPEWKARRRAKRPSRAKATTSEARLAALRVHNAEREGAPPPQGTVRDTATLCATLRVRGRVNHAIPVAQALEAPDIALPVPPYTLGAWLGDGASASGQLTGADAGIWERIEAEGFEVRHYTFNTQAHNIIGLKVRLRALGVLGNKHIPAVYLRASVAQRLALLQGLMDTDGYAAPDGGAEFDNTNERLAFGVLELARTLGLKATLCEGVAKLKGRVIGPKWRVKVTTSLPVFGLARKAARLKSTTNRRTRFRYLVSCEPVESVPTVCIAVDSPSRMYLAGEAMIPTHNTDLAIGKALTQHRVVQVFRREGTELSGIIDRMVEVLGHDEGLARSKPATWRNPAGAGVMAQVIEFCSAPNLGDERKYQGRAKDLLVIDEAANFLEAQVRFLMGWVRSVDPSLKPQTLLTFNPPTDVEGRWLIKFFAPWLDEKHPAPAEPGELRWFTTVNGNEIEVPDDRPFVMQGDHMVYEFDASSYAPDEINTPKSRTFIPAKIGDNPFLAGTNYMAQLQALPEPLRSQMLFGDFKAGIEDDPMQVIPTAWVEAAMSRWKPRPVKPQMTSLGVDVARGGKDNTIIARKHGLWYDELLCYPGTATPDGPTVAGLTIAARRDQAPIHIDVIGVGSSPYDFLKQAGQQVIGVNVSESALGLDKSGMLTFANRRSELLWRLREDLDPNSNKAIELPPDPRLLADLCAFTWRLQGKSIYVCSREDVIETTGRSPDFASALVLAHIETPRVRDLRAPQGAHGAGEREHNPFAQL